MMWVGYLKLDLFGGSVDEVLVAFGVPKFLIGFFRILQIKNWLNNTHFPCLLIMKRQLRPNLGFPFCLLLTTFTKTFKKIYLDVFTIFIVLQKRLAQSCFLLLLHIQLFLFHYLKISKVFWNFKHVGITVFMNLVFSSVIF